MGILNHRFVSTVADGPYPTQVNPSNWNEPHSFTGGNNGSLLVRSTSAPSSSEGIAWVNPNAVVNAILLGQGSSAAPAWSTVAWPATANIGDLIYATASSVIGNLSAAVTGSALISASSSIGPAWWNGQARAASNITASSSSPAQLLNVTGLSVTLSSAKTYEFESILYTTSSSASGVQFAVSGTATATAIIYEALVFDGTTLAAHTRAQASSTVVGGVTTVTAAYARITGTITVNAAGTLTVQFAQNSSSTGATLSTVLQGSVLTVWPIA